MHCVLPVKQNPAVHVYLPGCARLISRFKITMLTKGKWKLGIWETKRKHVLLVKILRGTGVLLIVLHEVGRSFFTALQRRPHRLSTLQHEITNPLVSLGDADLGTLLATLHEVGLCTFSFPDVRV